MKEVDKLAHEIANESARSDIECYSVWRELTAGPQQGRWYDMSDQDAVAAFGTNRSMHYLDLRGELIKHPDLPHLVRLKHPTDSPVR